MLSEDQRAALYKANDIVAAAHYWFMEAVQAGDESLQIWVDKMSEADHALTQVLADDQ